MSSNDYCRNKITQIHNKLMKSMSESTTAGILNRHLNRQVYQASSVMIASDIDSTLTNRIREQVRRALTD